MRILHTLTIATYIVLHHNGISSAEPSDGTRDFLTNFGKSNNHEIHQVSPHSSPEERYTEVVKSTLVSRIHPSLMDGQNRIFLDVHDEDEIIIRKVINGQFVPTNVVHGFLHRFNSDAHQNVRSNPPIIKDQHGRVEVTFLDPGHFFYASLTRDGVYWDHERDTRPVEYFCTIHRDRSIIFAAVLKSTHQIPLRWPTPRILFMNYLFPNSMDAAFSGELFVANHPTMRWLINSLSA